VTRSALLRKLVFAPLCAGALAACSGGSDSPPEGSSAGGNVGGSPPVASAGAAPTGMSGGGVDGNAGSAATTAGSSMAGANSVTAGASGSASTGGSAGMPSAGTGSAGAASDGELSVEPPQGLWTAVRYYVGSTPSGRTSGPKAPPEKTFKLHNGGTAPLAVTLGLTGKDAARFKLTAPAKPQLQLAPGADAEVTLGITTDNALLGAAPAQNDGATVLEASLELAFGGQKVSLRNYALVLTYVELEPTFGQIFRAFPQWTTKLPSWLPDNANPNPATLPGVEAGTDEVAASTFERLDATKPVSMVPLGRFSPSGLVPFGWYEPGKVAGRTTAGTLAMQTDPQTNDKARMLEPPLASGSISFTPGVAKFSIWMAPAGVGLLTSNDADGFDGQHRVRVWTLRDAAGAVVPGSFLIGGEEAKNGDYQDYVFALSNVSPL